MSARPIHCDIFCKVIDNFGDVGICWRLAQQLSLEFGWVIRLLIDDATALNWMASRGQGALVEVGDFDAAKYEQADVVIESFACEIPLAYQRAMGQPRTPPVWLNLEYLSAETWAAQSHCMASIHPQLGLEKYFFFPGFDAASGGLIRERDYEARRLDFDARAFRADHGLPTAIPNEVVISLFSYIEAPRDVLFSAWAASDTPIFAILPGDLNESWQRGNLRVRTLPFLTQRDYDELLWACDLNFVRGEDSFVRAQWAAKPMVWQIYPQDDGAHLVKLDSFMSRYSLVGAGETERPAVRKCPEAGPPIENFWKAWNGVGELNWPTFAQTLPSQSSQAIVWAKDLRQHPDLATNLRDFCLTRLNLG